MMKRFKVLAGLLTIAALLFSVSCVEIDTTVGSALVPTNSNIYVNTAEFDLPVGLKAADSIQTVVTGAVMVGSITSEKYGTFRSSGSVTVTPSTDSIVWGLNPEVRRVYIELSLASVQALDSSQYYIPQTFYVHRLLHPLDSIMVYNNSIGERDYDHAQLADQTIVYTGESSITVELKPDFGKEFFKFSMEQLDSTAYFINHFNGLYFCCDDIEEGTLGGRLNTFDLSNSAIHLEYYYTDEDDGKRKIDEVTFDMGTVYSVNTMSSESGIYATKDAKDLLYVESFCGIKPHIDAVKLKKILSDWAESNLLDMDDILISKAVLEFPFDYKGDPSVFNNFPSSLFPCRRIYNAKKNTTNYVPLDEVYESELEAGDINRSLLNYRSDACIYIQELIQKQEYEITREDDLWIMPIIEYSNSQTGEIYYYADYAYYTQCELFGTGCVRRPTLRITYSVLQ